MTTIYQRKRIGEPIDLLPSSSAVMKRRFSAPCAIPGAVVECGVWKGSSMAAAARTLLQMNDANRDLYLFDRFTGMTEPGSEDVEYFGRHASQVCADWVGANAAWCDVPLEQVKKVLCATGYLQEQIHFIEQTIPASGPESIALLHLDTDRYDSSRHGLIHLFPHLIRARVLIIDDSRKACDEYFEPNRVPILLNRIDAGGRVAVRL